MYKHKLPVTIFERGGLANAHIVEVVDLDTVHEDIVGSMEVETFFNFCIWCEENVGPCCSEYKSVCQAHGRRCLRVNNLG